MGCIKPLSLLLVAILAASTMPVRWTWWDLRDSELKLHGRSGGQEIYESSKYCRDPTMCRLHGFYYDLRTLHCYKIQSLAEETYVDIEESDPDDSICYNLGGGHVKGEHGYHFKRDPEIEFSVTPITDMYNEIHTNIVPVPTPPSTNEPIANAASGDMEVYQTANSLFGYRELKFWSNGLYLLRLMFALVEEDDRHKTRTFSIHLSGYDDKLTLKNKLNIFEEVGFYKAYDFFTTIRLRNQSHLIFAGKTMDTWANTAQLHFEPGSYYKDLMNGYCLTRFHSCNKYCHDPIKCKAKSGCIYDFENSHCIDDLDEEEICIDYSHNKTMCTENGCSYCCETSICSMEANANCMDTDCGRYCMEETMCLKNKPEICSYNSEEGTCVVHTPTPKLQVAFVINAGIDPQNDNSTQVFKNTSVLFAEKIKEVYGDPEFAVTSFADWDKTVWPGNHDDEEGCYKLLQEMTTDTAKIEQELMHVGPSNGATALAWTCADSRIGWKKGKLVETNKGSKRPLVRILILFDLREFYEPERTSTNQNFENSWGNRMESLVSGINMCQLNKPPYLEAVYNTLTLHDASVIGVFDVENGKYYEEFFSHKFLTILKEKGGEEGQDILDTFNEHVAERANPRREFEKEKLCQSSSPNKTSCRLNGCSFCCETLTCTAEPNSDCMDTNCRRYCFESKQCAFNGIPNTCYYNSEDGSCVDCPLIPKLQVAIVVDAARSFQPYFGSQYVFEALLKYLERFTRVYEDPEFALTSFADWDNKVWQVAPKPTTPKPPPKDKIRKHKKKMRPIAKRSILDLDDMSHNDPEGCYKLVQKMTMDMTAIKAAEIVYLNRSRKNNGPSALSWSASDPRLGWKDANLFMAQDLKKRPLVKLMIIIDHEGFYADDGREGLNWGNRKESVDGLNTCENNMRQNLDDVYKVLAKHDVIVFGILSGNAFSFYKDNFKYSLYEAVDARDESMTVGDIDKQLHLFIAKKVNTGINPACLNYGILP